MAAVWAKGEGDPTESTLGRGLPVDLAPLPWAAVSADTIDRLQEMEVGG